MDVVIWSAAAGAALAATMFGGAAAQDKPPGAYYVIEVTATDPEADAKLATLLSPIVKEFGGRFLTRGGKTVSFDGAPPQRFVILAFDSMEQAQAWNDSPKRKEVEAKRVEAGATIRAFAIEALRE